MVSCESYKNCKKKPCEKIHFDCKCDIEYKIPEIEREFVVDQREKVGEHGKFMMGQVDWAVAKQHQTYEEKAQKKKQSELDRGEASKQEAMIEVEAADYIREFFEEDSQTNEPKLTDEESESDEDFQAAVNTKHKNISQSRIPVPTVVREQRRFDASNRLVASIVTAAYKDAGLIDQPGGEKYIIDQNKIMREGKLRK